MKPGSGSADGKHGPLGRYAAGVDESPELITMNAIAADVTTMRLREPQPHAKDEELPALLLATVMALEQVELGSDADHDVLERELVRIAALCVRLIERR